MKRLNHRQKAGTIMLLIAILVCVHACSKPKNNSADGVEITQALQLASDRVIQTYTDGDKEICIDADVDLPETDTIEVVTLAFDEDAMNQMAESLIVTQYENISRPSSYQWDAFSDGNTLLATFGVDTDNWSAAYTDAIADLSGPYYEDEHMMSFNFITQQLAPGMNKSGSETAGEVCRFFEPYSALQFIPYRVLAGESDGRGFYTVWAQGAYNGILVCPRLSNSTAGLGIYASVSSEKVFWFQSKFLFKVERSEGVNSLVPLNTVMDKLENNFGAFMPDGERVTIGKIVLEYFATENSNGKFTLRPVWSLYGKGSDIFETEWLFSYFADDGSFCSAGPLFY